MTSATRRFLQWILDLASPAPIPALASESDVNDHVVHFAALLCCHCPDVTFAEALEVAVSVLVDIEIPLGTGAVAADALNVRDRPGVDGQGNPLGTSVSVLTAGNEVEMWCIRADGWALVVWDGDGGWCSSEYLKHAAQEKIAVKTKNELMPVGRLAGERCGAKQKGIATSRVLLHRVITAVLLLFALWSAFVIAYPVAGNGWMYHVKQPLPIILTLTDASEPRVLLRFDQHSMWTMNAVVHRELHCDSVQALPSEEIVLREGRANSVKVYPFLWVALNDGDGSATCHYAGASAYSPFGKYGPQITYGWLSEEFMVDRRLAK